MNGEAYADFALLYLLCHQSRVEAERPEECWLERWSRAAEAQGTRALDQLRKGVEEAISALGAGLPRPSRQRRAAAQAPGRASSPPTTTTATCSAWSIACSSSSWPRIGGCCSIRRPRPRPRPSTPASTPPPASAVWPSAGAGDGTPTSTRVCAWSCASWAKTRGCPELGLPALGSFLFSEEGPAALGSLDIANRDLLAAVRGSGLHHGQATSAAPSTTATWGARSWAASTRRCWSCTPRSTSPPAPSRSRAAAAASARPPAATTRPPASSSACSTRPSTRWWTRPCANPTPKPALLALKVCDPACGSGHFLVAAAHRLAKRLAAAAHRRRGALPRGPARRRCATSSATASTGSTSTPWRSSSAR